MKQRQTNLFKELALVMTYAEAYKQVNIAYEGYTANPRDRPFSLHEPSLIAAFDWGKTPQGSHYWYGVYKSINNARQYCLSPKSRLAPE